MKYQRPRPVDPLSKAERRELLENYFSDYKQLAKSQPDALNRKVPRKALTAILDRIGRLLLREATAIASKPSPLREFLDDNPLPNSLQKRLPDEFRAFCLLLNALKQWVVAEQAATDRYLLGGRVRDECRGAATHCAISGIELEPGNIELHHPIRDGRPPIAVDKKAHALLEGQLKKADGKRTTRRRSRRE